MVNIVSNAIKYTEIGGTIQIRMEALDGNRYRFICSDNGIGMKPEYIRHICEEYSRAEDSRLSATEGTGLGMAVEQFAQSDVNTYFVIFMDMQMPE